MRNREQAISIMHAIYVMAQRGSVENWEIRWVKVACECDVLCASGLRPAQDQLSISLFQSFQLQGSARANHAAAAPGSNGGLGPA